MRKKANYPDWVLKHKRKGTAIHKIGGNFYLYKIHSEWDSEKVRARKVTDGYLGKITPEGLQKPRRRAGVPTGVKEYGASVYLLKGNEEIMEGLRDEFGYWWKELMSLGILRLEHRSALKLMASYYEDSWLSEELGGARLNQKAITELLMEVGAQRGRIVNFLRRYITGDENLLIDLTNVFSKSKGMSMVARGYNSLMEFEPQVNLLFMFNVARKRPMYYRIVPGDVRDVATFKATLEESGLMDAIIIGDKGFYSERNTELFEESGIRYILPLKRNSRLIDYTKAGSGDRREMDGYFEYMGRFIWYYCKEYGKRRVCVFLDDEARVKEGEDYLRRIKTHPEMGYTVEGYHRKYKSFGTLALITGMKDFGVEKIYSYYKSRGEIEVMFDTFKNLLHADRSYMRTDKAMEAWMFIT